MIGIKMKPNIPVHYQKGNTLQKGSPPLPTYNPPIFLFFYFYFICTKIVLQEKIIPPHHTQKSAWTTDHLGTTEQSKSTPTNISMDHSCGTVAFMVLGQFSDICGP